MNTLLLDLTNWDLVVDVSGNIALATDPYSQGQDAASAIKLFQGELYYDTTQGLPYFQSILGKFPPLSLIKQQFSEAALTVPGVTGAACFISSIQGRTISGQVQITNTTGQTAAANF
jgi:hypothetical protein